MQMLSPSRFHFPSHSKGTPSKKRTSLTRIPPLAHIPPHLPSRNLPSSFPHPPTRSLPPRPQQQQPPLSPLDQCHHQLPAAQKANPARQTDGPAVLDRKRKARSTLMGPQYHPPTQSKNPVRGAAPVGPSHKARTTPLLPSHRPRLICTQVTCSLVGRSRTRSRPRSPPRHEACIQTSNLGSQVLRVGFWTSASMYPRVLSVPRVGQFIRSGRYTYVGALGERSNAKCWMMTPKPASADVLRIHRTESTQHTLNHSLV